MAHVKVSKSKCHIQIAIVTNGFFFQCVFFRLFYSMCILLLLLLLQYIKLCTRFSPLSLFPRKICFSCCVLLHRILIALHVADTFFNCFILFFCTWYCIHWRLFHISYADSEHPCSEFSKLACFESLVYCQAFVSSSFLWFPFRVCICICMLDAIFLFYSRYCCFSLEMLIFINAFHLRSWLCMRVEFASIQGKLWIKSVNLKSQPY